MRATSHSWIALAALAAISFVLLISFVWPMDSEKYTEKHDRYFLGLLVTVKNEGIVLDEFIRHYLWQGVEHIYLIDNGSDKDDKIHDIIRQHVQSGKLSYFFKPERHKQAEHYNDIFHLRAKRECKWLAVLDADEFVYNTTRGQTISSYLENVDYINTNAISLNWKMFGSSNHDRQPASVRKHFTLRKPGLDPHTKAIVNTSRTKNLHIHSHVYSEGGDIIHNTASLALNHYPIMSKEYFEKVKMRRGDVADGHSDNVRDWDYFNKYDENTRELDTQLADMVIDDW